MEELELLELAALAAGYQLQRMCDPVESGEEGSEFFHLNGRYWNPRNDDGDSMRLAVDAKISFGTSKQTGRPIVCWSVNGDIRKSEMHKDPEPKHNDPGSQQYAESATEWVRSAIFYAATDIGHHMRMLQKVRKEHIKPELRKCYAPDCWDCDGTGIDMQGFVCTSNNGVPF